MAHKSIATQILEDLRKKQNQELEKEKDICLEFMQKNFNSRLSSFEKMKTNTDYCFIQSENFPIPLDDFADIAGLLGFHIKVHPIEEKTYFFAIPARKKGTKATPAHVMLETHNISVNQKIKDRDKEIQEEINYVWDTLKGRGFTSQDNKDGSFTLTILLHKDRLAEAYSNAKILSFLSSRAFPNACIEGNVLTIVLGIKTK